MKKASKIITLKKLGKVVEPRKVTLISGSFDPFNSYYRKLLTWASLQSRPLVVVVHTDRAVSIRRGLSRPTENQKKRAENVAGLDFVDYVVISSKGAHDKKIVKLLKPRLLLFQQDNTSFLAGLFSIINRKFPGIGIRVSPIKKEIVISTVPSKITPNNIKNPILKRVLELARTSTAPVGRVSAVLVSKSKVLAESSNLAGGEHAEKVILDRLLGKNMEGCSLYVLIPPCPMCADSIIRAKLKNVYYLFNYGDKMGVERLHEAGIVVRKIKLV
ncbi:MAG: deaminase [Patescibacteria group bacterium]